MKGTFYENNWIPDKSGGLRKSKQEENKYCKRVKRTQVILYPQLETYAIKTMKRYYHISLISKITKTNYLIWLMPNEEMKVVVEYLDEWQGSSFHWNANRTTQPYKRTATEQQSVLRECVRYEKMPI